jgi:hypothetical protein
MLDADVVHAVLAHRWPRRRHVLTSPFIMWLPRRLHLACTIGLFSGAWRAAPKLAARAA